jgi:hypothetical protein
MPSGPSDLATLAALAVADQDRAATQIKVALGKRQRFAGPQSGAPEHDDQATQPDRVVVVAACMTAMISSTVGGSAG